MNDYADFINLHLTALKSCMDKGGVVLTNADFATSMEFFQYGQDRSRLAEPDFSILLEPVATSEIAAVLSYCSLNDLPVIVSGGRTGLVGGAIAANNEIVLSMRRMDRFIGYDKSLSAIRVQAGMITARVDEHAKQYNKAFPIDLAASGSSQVGGNIATHAGGIRVIRYGLLRQHVLGLTVVTARGEVLQMYDNVLKNNTGYPLMQLFIGSEGTLGVITEVSIKLVEPPVSSQVALLQTASLQDAIHLLELARKKGLNPYAWEYFDSLAMQVVCEHLSLPIPFSTETNHHILLEWDSTEFNEEQMHDFFTDAMARNLLLDGKIASSSAARRQFWQYREGISESLSIGCKISKNDISVPIQMIPDFVKKLADVVSSEYPDIDCIVFGHLGDGNLHINLREKRLVSHDKTNLNAGGSRESAQAFETNSKSIHEWLNKQLVQMGGSISAEHGIGILKLEALQSMHGKTELNYMKQLKNLFDPKGILNPGRIFK